MYMGRKIIHGEEKKKK